MRNKRQDPEIKSKERDSKRNKRQDPEFKDKERDRMRNKRQDPEIKSKERDSKISKKQDPEFKDNERDRKRNKRQNAEFKGKERDSKRNKRQDPEFKDNERDRMRNKRQNAEFKGKERDSKRNKRQDPEFKSKERDSKRIKRQEEEYRHDEQIRDLKKKKQMRQNSNQLEKERLKMKEKRKNEHYRTSENIAAKQSKAHSRGNLDDIETEKQRYRKNDNWFHEVTNSASELMREFIEGHTNEDSAMHDQSDGSDSDEFCEVDSGKDGNRDTLLDSDSYDMNQIFTFAPGEGQRPISLYQDQMAEYLSFPTIFCAEGRVENDQRQVPVSYADIAKWELRSADRRAAQSAEQMAQDDLTEAYDELAPGAQQTDADDEYEGTVDSETFVHFNPERPIEQREYDIGSDVGIPSTRQLNEQSSVRLPDDEYLKLVASLNLKQQEFFNHVMQWIKYKQEPIHAYLSGGAGVGKSVLIRALYQALHRYLAAKEGENPDDIRILLCAYTGKAAFYIGGQTIVSAFHQKINQKAAKHAL
ncbi:zinc finger CCCH domain-containing protein 13-like [Crassostrea angulata]|uniref:zinc finger CCCH domain-containing protein 13-like n=1 Tax=Magallana angulata TaxID=2784310 RepID=UPI0022B1ED6C|nr:zinc finger CCCH domain-containing protein 13-like [Crassostrea angulata]